MKLRFNKSTKKFIQSWVEDMKDEYQYITETLYIFDGIDAETSITLQIETTKELLVKLDECLEKYKDKYDFINIKLKTMGDSEYGEVYLDDGLAYVFIGFKKRSEKEINTMIKNEIKKFYDEKIHTSDLITYGHFFNLDELTSIVKIKNGECIIQKSFKKI